MPSNARIHGAKVKETRTYHFDIWKMELSRVKHYMQVEPSGQLKNPNTPSNVTHEVAMTLDVEIFRQEKMKMNAQQPNHFNALVAHAMKYLKGMTVQCSKVRNAHIASMTAQQATLRQKQLEEEQRAQQEQLTSHYLHKQLREAQQQIQSHRQDSRKRPRDEEDEK
jgi:hypothetical protein